MKLSVPRHLSPKIHTADTFPPDFGGMVVDAFYCETFDSIITREEKHQQPGEGFSERFICRMKSYLPSALGLVCLVLVISLVLMKRSDLAQHENDVSVIAESSNQLAAANTRLAIREGRILVLSNSLDASLSASSALSNRLIEAQSTIAVDREQITNLTRQITGKEAENQNLAGRITDLTNQMAGLVRRLSSTEARLNALTNDYARNYALLENRLRRDVAERVVVERRFNSLSELQAQVERLKEHPAAPITPQSIYAGLDVEVKSNGTFHVLSPD